MRFVLPILPLLLFAVSASHAASLHLCPAASPASGLHQAELTRPDGSRQKLFVSGASAVAGCRSMQLPVPLDAVAGLKPIASAAMLGTSVILQGPQDKTFSIGSVTGSGAPEPEGRLAMPMRENLLLQMSSRVFGSEERAQARIEDGRLTLECRAGSKPAGVILTGPWSMSQAQMALQLSSAGNGRHEVQVLDAAGLAKENAVSLGSLAAGQPADFALPRAGFDRAGWRAFAIACPRQQASLQISDLRLLPRPVAAGPRSTWVWDALAWQERSEEVFAHALQHGIRTLFIAVPLQAGRVAQPQRLAGFIREAGRRGIAVWSVDGDPQMVLPQEHAASAARVRAYVGYNAGVEPAARLRGMQFDVEHYLLPGYELAVRDWDRRYIDLARALHKAAAGLPLEFVVPFWWADKSELLRTVTPFASGLAIMDYRTRQEEILRFATPFLDWGTVHGKQVRIALEAGPVAAEQQRRYTQAESGELWLLALDRAPLLLLLNEARPNPFGAAYRQTSSSVLDGSATSFHRDPARMLQMLPQLEQDFSAWRSFNGMALHELK